MPEPFAWDGRHLPDIVALRTYLATLQPPSWSPGKGKPAVPVKCVVLHHTWKPTRAQWRGATTMAGLKRYYRDEVIWYDAKGRKQRGWSAGPHMFLAPDGFWIGTQPTTQGVHAGTWNSKSIGIEIVGNYDIEPWPEKTRHDVLEAVDAYFDWLRIPAVTLDTLRGHRECGSPKSCPGSKIDMHVVRQWAAARIA